MSDLVIDCYSISARLDCGPQGINGELDIFMEGRHEQIWFRCMFTGMLFRGVIRDFSFDDSRSFERRSLRIRAIPIADDSPGNPMSMMGPRLGSGA